MRKHMQSEPRMRRAIDESHSSCCSAFGAAFRETETNFLVAFSHGEIVRLVGHGLAAFARGEQFARWIRVQAHMNVSCSCTDLASLLFQGLRRALRLNLFRRALCSVGRFLPFSAVRSANC